MRSARIGGVRRGWVWAWKAAALAALVALPLLAACDTGQVSQPAGKAEVGTAVKTEKGNQYTDLTADELKAMMDKGDFFHVDVHVPNEGKLPQLDARIPFDKIAEELDQLPQDKGTTIVLTCKSGGMSAKAATTLADLGYTDVYNLVGGFVAWKDKGYPFTPEP